ncbi:MAG: exodeoxyribonuclease VII large subunit [Clostridiales Family XIII bacterium]|jgi:exodeoxyribonuclease VII large subunit|nr:exodeoxyribonuclease VII large subunit [Clostridiales Family XIII bacterium]
MAGKPVRVSRLNSYIRRVLQADPLLLNLSVIGEISNFKHHSSGHVYFTLKDESSKINCFLPSNVYAQVPLRLEDGMEIVADGYINVYEKGGYYSFSIRGIHVEGTGNLAANFEKLKQDLRKEGLFDASHKKILPKFPRQIAIITASTGAAIQDMLSIMTGKNDFVRVLVYSVLVQGPNAAKQNATAVETINRDFPETDLMILGRGGGSIEELWAYNEEILARAIFASEIPIISAVGHETDVTIADFVADVRAETPTAAAQMAVPDTEELAVELDMLRNELDLHMTQRISDARYAMNSFRMEQLHRILSGRLALARKEAEGQIREMQQRTRQMVKDGFAKAAQLHSSIEALNPIAILSRGYSVLLNAEGKNVHSVKQLSKGKELSAVLSDGNVSVIVDAIGGKQ